MKQALYYFFYVWVIGLSWCLLAASQINLISINARRRFPGPYEKLPSIMLHTLIFTTPFFIAFFIGFIIVRNGDYTIRRAKWLLSIISLALISLGWAIFLGTTKTALMDTPWKWFLPVAPGLNILRAVWSYKFDRNLPANE